jgi:hypothetical protein
VIHDVVFNDKMGADEKETVHVHRVDLDDRQQIENKKFQAPAYTRFTFPSRDERHSRFIWDQKCFSGVEWELQVQLFRLVPHRDSRPNPLSHLVTSNFRKTSRPRFGLFVPVTERV